MSSSKLLILNAMVLGGRGRVGPGGGALINGICENTSEGLLVPSAMSGYN
jgi:hypothetical protein